MDISKSYAIVSSSLYSQEFIIGVLERVIPGDTDLAAELCDSCRSSKKVYDGMFPNSIQRFSCWKGYTGNPHISNGCVGKTNLRSPLLRLLFHPSIFTLSSSFIRTVVDTFFSFNQINLLVLVYILQEGLALY